jgi:geranylgeranyl diphosphate synthase type II
VTSLPFIDAGRIKVDKTLRELLPSLDRFPERLHEAMHYTLFAGGKRLRPVLAMAACQAVSGEGDRALTVGCAIELIHTYSLVHDDLPSMDNDDYRRGQLTVHKKFGEAIAILTGDALLTEAFTLLASSRIASQEPGVLLRVIRDLSEAAGSRGMVGGQVYDLALEGKKEVTVAMLERLHACKTGALITAAVSAGARIGGADETELAALTAYGRKIGLAFQIKDDILDIVGKREELGKSVGKDRAAHKVTYPDLIGLPGAESLQKTLADEAVNQLTRFGDRADPLRDIAHFCVERTN